MDIDGSGEGDVGVTERDYTYLTVRLDKKLKRALRIAAAKADLNTSQFIRRAIRKATGGEGGADALDSYGGTE